MRQAVRRSIHTRPSLMSRIARMIRLLFFGLSLILALLILLSLISYNPNDPAWSKAIQTSVISNWLGYKGAYFADIVLVALGNCAWYIPLLIGLYAYNLFYKNKVTLLTFEIFLIRLVGVIFIFITLSGLYDISNTANTSGGIIGQWIGTKFTMFSFSWINQITDNPSALLYTSQLFLFFLLTISAILASGKTPIYWAELTGKGIMFLGHWIFSKKTVPQIPSSEEKDALATIAHLMEHKTPEHKSLLARLIPAKKSVAITPDAATSNANTSALHDIDRLLFPTQPPVASPKNPPSLSSVTAAPPIFSAIDPEPMVSETPHTEPAPIPKVFSPPKIREQAQPQNAAESRATLTSKILELTDWVNNTEVTTSKTESANLAHPPLFFSEHPEMQTPPAFDNHRPAPDAHHNQYTAAANVQRPKANPMDDEEHADLMRSLENFLNPVDMNEPTPNIQEFSFDQNQESSEVINYSFDLNENSTQTPFYLEEDAPIVDFNFTEIDHALLGDATPPPANYPAHNHDAFTLIHEPRPTTPQIDEPFKQQQNAPQPPVKAQGFNIDPRSGMPVANKAPAYFPMAGKLPDLNLLGDPPPYKASYNASELNEMAQLIEEQLKHFGISVTVANIEPGPVITRFELDLAPGVKVAQINNLSKDIARAMSVTSVRVVDIIPGKTYVGLEIPNARREIVYFKEGLSSVEYRESHHPLTMILGKDIAGETLTANLGKMPHLLVAGTTGSGKSVGINTMLLSLLFKATPDELRLILIDPKMLELSVYDDIPHLLAPVVTDMKESANALRWCVAEMERRYLLMSQLKVRNIAGFNKKVNEAAAAGSPIIDPLWNRKDHVSDTQSAPYLKPLPFIVVVIDEFADMMMLVGKKCEELIARLAQKARASGIHLILATQRPSVDVITGLIKANIPTRIAFQVSSRIDSRTIIDQQGAETLLGHGDMLFLPPGVGIPIRVHGAFVDDHEVNKVVEFLKLTGAPDYIEDILNEPLEPIPGLSAEASGVALPPTEVDDPLFDEAVKTVVESQRASISYVQRKLRVGYQRAARLIEEMEAQGIISAPQSNGSRDVLMASSAMEDMRDEDY